MWLFQNIMLIQNPEPYLKQSKDSDSAIVMNNATLYWTKPESQADPDPDLAQGSGENRVEEIPKAETTLPTLRNISFTLPKVSLAADTSQHDMAVYELKHSLCFIDFLKGKLLGVCGNVGSGKTSLISSILEQVGFSFDRDLFRNLNKNNFFFLA